MPVDPAGNYSLPPSYFALPGTTIRTDQHNPVLEDIGQAISGRLMRDGRGGMVGALDMGSFAISNVAPGIAATDAATVGQGVPIGTVVDFAGAAAPSDWLLCYGQAISRSTYAALFAILGTTYGAGNGSTTFLLPDCRGRVAAGKDDMGGTSANRLTNLTGGVNGDIRGAVGGAQSHTLTEAQLAAHNHTGTTSSSGLHTHTIKTTNDLSGSSAAYGAVGGDLQWFAAGETNSGGAHTHTFATASSGSGSAHNNLQPTIILNKIIKATI